MPDAFDIQKWHLRVEEKLLQLDAQQIVNQADFHALTRVVEGVVETLNDVAIPAAPVRPGVTAQALDILGKILATIADEDPDRAARLTRYLNQNHPKFPGSGTGYRAP